MLEPSELFPEVPNLYELSVHQEMIYDEHRVIAYENAIRGTVKSGDVVVDVGSNPARKGLIDFDLIPF